MGRRRKFQEIFKIKGFKLLEIKMWNTCLSNFVCCLRFFWIWELKAYIMCTNVNPGHSRCMTQCQNLGPMATLIYIVQSFIYYYCVICIHGCSSLEFYSADVIDNVGDNTKPCCTLDVTNWWVLGSTNIGTCFLSIIWSTLLHCLWPLWFPYIALGDCDLWCQTLV